MQRAQLFTSWEAVLDAPRARRLERLALPAFWLLCAAAAGVFLAQCTRPPVWDQARLLAAELAPPFHPAPPFAFTAQLLVIALKAVLPATAPLHEVLRCVAMVFWTGAATWLGSLLLERRASVALLVVALFSSQFPFLWLSSELVAGGFLCLAVGAWQRGASPWLLGPLLALLGLCKMELLLVAGVLLLYWLHLRSSRQEAMALGASFAGSLLLLLLPGLLHFGPAYLIAYGPDGQGRGFATFAQHFAALVAPFQLAPAPDPWRDAGPYVERVFPGAASMGDVLTTRGLPYLDFVALSAARGLRRAGWLFQWAWLAVPGIVWGWRRGSGLGVREKTLLLSFVGCIPFVLLSYPHVRYLARYYPVFWLLLLLGVEALARLEDSRARRLCLAASGAFVLLALAVNVDRLSAGLAVAPGLELYWFPD